MSDINNLDSAIQEASIEMNMEIRAKPTNARFTLGKIRVGHNPNAINTVTKVSDIVTGRTYIVSVNLNVIHSDEKHDFDDEESLEKVHAFITKAFKSIVKEF